MRLRPAAGLPRRAFLAGLLGLAAAITPAYLTDLDCRLVDEARDLHRLLAPFVFESAIVGRVEVPAGFLTDFASVPRLPFAYVVVGGKGKRAAVIHDWLYSGGLVNGQPVDRKTADRVFAEALKASGYGFLVENLMYAGVRVGGGSRFEAPNVPQPPHVAAEMGAGALVAP